jgi:uncharacterized protein (DUF1810 family)
MADPCDLQRFVDAQAPVVDAARAELRRGRKQSHWMWFIFPQTRGLGRSPMAERFAIGSLDEARAYLAHPILGTRLRECARLVADVDGRSIGEILGPVDAVKFRSSMTLFARASADETVFTDALDKYFAGEPDAATLEKLTSR